MLKNGGGTQGMNKYQASTGHHEMGKALTRSALRQKRRYARQTVETRPILAGQMCFFAARESGVPTNQEAGCDAKLQRSTERKRTCRQVKTYCALKRAKEFMVEFQDVPQFKWLAWD